MSTTTTYGRNRQSIADIEREIDELFRIHPQSTTNDDDDPVIPGHALVDILRTFSQNHDALQLMTREEEEQLIELIETNPGLAVTPQVLLAFIAQKTTATPGHSPEGTPFEDADAIARAREEERTEYEYDTRSRSRSSSPGSIGTSVYRPPSRSSSRGPPAVPPKTPVRDSPFDASRRQRTTPLAGPNAPSSWTRRPPPQRRRSDAGRDMSDSESISAPPMGYSRSQGSISGRVRSPSNPVSPDPYSERGSGSFSPISIGSPNFGGSYSRPHSRTQSHGHFGSLDGFAMRHRSISPESERDFYQHEHTTGLMSPPPSDRDMSFDDDDDHPISSLPLPSRHRSSSDGSDDDDDDDPTLLRVHERIPTTSTISLDMAERVDALQRINDELRRKLSDTEDNLQRRLAEREAEIEDMQQRLDEFRNELSVAKRQEKDLKAKERTNSTQIQSLEQSIAQLSRSLENSRQAYQNLNIQYAEQCEESQRYRELVVGRDNEIQQLKESSALQALDLKKWEDEQAHWLEQMRGLQEELAAAQRTAASLDEQKQDNMMLKEVIDRLRFELEEMRATANSGHSANGGASAKGTISKSLGAELLRKLETGEWEGEERPAPAPEPVEEESEDDDTEDEDIVQTIITRTKRKVGSRAKKIETVQVEEVKEYSDASVQHELSTKTFCVQTEPEARPAVAAMETQTDEAPSSTMSVQTEPEPTPVPVVRVEMEIQTDEPEPEASSGSNQSDEEETLASSSSTLLPPTPKAQTLAHLEPSDLPPSYHQVAGEDQDALAKRVADETLKKWHAGLRLPIAPLPGGLSEDAVEDWKALKDELGVGCGAIDRLVAASAHTRAPRTPKTPRRGRFYNIYNTYVYGDKPDAGAPPAASAPLLSAQTLFCVGASAAVAFVVGTMLAQQPHAGVPGGATYYDRAAWSSFNALQAGGEGFPGVGEAGALPFLGFLGRLSGAARTVQGRPT
ncbi:hypothetical protein PsYK624_059350 [Phanerochaete sordida]|uniref:Uncharacterized protein n=1 Tax=Phanerochaete sordida TaxID=48140 RepID=A0A9P3G7P2_9APHY|nr:hypothetical protein PsYK624_059350 [Phanerochaete sordida]